jgi:hypothetical protein
MKILRSVFLGVVSSCCIAVPAAMAEAAPERTALTPPSLEFAFAAQVMIATPTVVGTGPHGLRRIVAITGGTFEGARIKGSILAGGADWQFVRADGVLQIDAKYTLRTHDGVTIMITNRGMRHGPADVIERLAKGEAVDPSSYYFRTVAEFEAPSDSAYAWLNKAIFVATAERRATVVNVRFYEVK